MFLVNPCEVPLTRNNYKNKTKIVIEDSVVYGETDVDFKYTDEGIVISPYGEESEPYVYDPDATPKGSFISSVHAGASHGLFNRGEDLDDDPLIWIASPTVLIANGMPVEMSVIYLDDGLLVCLQKGAIQVQVDDEGTTQTLTRGIKGIDEDQKFMSATEENFDGMPKYANESIMSVTLKRGIKQAKKDTYLSLETAVKVHRDSSALLDNGDQYNQEEMERQRVEAERREAAEARAAEDEEVARLRAEEEEKRVKAAGEREKSKTKSKSASPQKRDSSKRNAGASAFLVSTGIQK